MERTGIEANRKHIAGFTLIELLVVVGITAVLAAVVILTLNPAEILRRARDSRRLADLGSLTKSVGIYELENAYLGEANTIYLSIPDLQATTTQGTNCFSFGLPPLPSGWSRHCAASSTVRSVSGEGWVPLNFALISSGRPISSLPVDPINTTSSGNYYTYVMGGSWKVSALLESEKYAPKMSSDGGPDPGIYEAGTNLGIAPFGRGLVGYWRFDEGTGSMASDASGYSNQGTVLAGASTPQWASGRVGNAIDLDGADDMINIPATAVINQQGDRTFSAWIFPTATSYERDIIDGWHNPAGTSCGGHHVGQRNDGLIYRSGSAIDLSATALGIPTNIFTYIAVVQRGSPATVEFYVNGALRKTMGPYSVVGSGSCDIKIGGRNSSYSSGLGSFPGKLDEVRIYNRALSANEIKAIYDATK